MIQYALYTANGGTLITDDSGALTDLTISTNARGFAECRARVPLSLADAFRRYDRPGLPHVVVSDSSSGPLYEGRLEDVAISGDGVELTALGYSRALSDLPYAALWSDARLSLWQPLTYQQLAVAWPTGVTVSANGYLQIAPQKNSVWNNTILAALTYQISDKSTRYLRGIQFDWMANMPSPWQIYLQIYDTSTLPWTSLGNVWHADMTGALMAGSVNEALTGNVGAVSLLIFCNTATPTSVTGETGAAFARFFYPRVVTSTANRVATTLTSGYTPGGSMAVGSTANMYVGQRIILDSGAASGSTSCFVTSVDDATHLHADGSSNYAAGVTVRAHVITADEIARDLIASVAAVNPAQLSASTALVQAPGVDLPDVLYEDRDMADILDDLCGSAWEWGVWEGQRLVFRPRATAGRVWYVDAAALQVQRTIDSLANSVVAAYQDYFSNRTLRTAASADAASVARYGLTRRTVIGAQTPVVWRAQTQQAAALADGKDPRPRVGLTIESVADAAGARWPLWLVKAGDTIALRNLPPTLTTAIDRVRTFRIGRTTYDAVAHTLAVEPESPIPTLDALIAQQARDEAARRAALPWWSLIPQGNQ